MSDEQREYEGRSVAEAAIKACEDLGITRSQLPYKVLSEKGEGLERWVTIAVDVTALGTKGKDTSPSPEESVGDDRRGKRRRESGRGRGRDREHREPRSRRDERPQRKFERDKSVDELLNLPQADDKAGSRSALQGELSPGMAKAVEVAAELVKRMGFALEARATEEDEGELHVDFVGEDAQKVIGKTGDVLLALQVLVNRMISRGGDADQVVVLDAAGYRARRKQALEDLAMRLAERAVEEGKAVRLSPISAHDRRIIHMVLKDHQRVSTRSEGEGLFRKMLIIPLELD